MRTTLLLLLLALWACQGKKSAPQALVPAPKVLLHVDFSQGVSRSTHDRLDAFWNALHKRTHYSGITLLADHDSFYVWSAGLADSAKPLLADMPMQIASISKPFCATAIMILVHEGKISLQDSLRKFFPKLNYPGITIQLLLNHGTGLPEYTWFSDTYLRDSLARIKNSDVIRVLEEQHPESYYAPGRRHRYTNTNFILLASIVEQVSKQAYGAFLKSKIFQPLGMTKTRVLDPNFKVEDLEVKGHDGNGVEFEPHYQDGTYGDKNIVSTVYDLYRFYMGLRKNLLFPEAIREQMFATQWARARRGTAYAYGWRKRIDEEGNEWMFHSGWWHGFRTNFYFNMEHHQCAVTLSNRLSGGFIPGRTLVAMFHTAEWNDILKAWDLGVATSESED